MILIKSYANKKDQFSKSPALKSDFYCSRFGLLWIGYSGT